MSSYLNEAVVKLGKKGLTDIKSKINTKFKMHVLK